MRKAQVAVEYMIIMGFVSFIVIFLIAASQLYQRSVTNQVILDQVDNLAREIVDSAESVYFLGEPSRTTIKANMPKNVNSVIVYDHDIVFKVNARGGLTDISRTSSVNLTGSIANFEGQHTITLETKCSELLGCYVNITG